MRVHKRTINWMTRVCIISFLISLILYHSVQNEYWSNIFIGIFSSGILTLLISTISYNIERQKVLEEFYIQAIKVLGIINMYDNNGDIEKSIESVIEMANYDYVLLDNAYGNIDFIFSNRKLRKYIYDDIYKPITDMKNLIIDKTFHFKEYKKAANGNLNVMKIFIEEINQVLMFKEYKEVQSSDGTICKIEYSYNKFVRNIKKELNTKYYRIMYGKATLF